MAETASERTLRLKAEREARRAREKKLTPRQCALALLRRTLLDIPPDKMQVAVFMHKWNMNDRTYFKVVNEYNKARTRLVASIERSLKTINRAIL